MNNISSMPKILILGTMPPPIGGVTIHIDRFLNYEQNIYHLAVLDIKKRILFFENKKISNILTILQYFMRAKVVHIHISNVMKVPFAFIARVFLKKVVYTHHNSRISSKIQWRLINMLSHKVVLVNDKSIDKSIVYPLKTAVIPAFLPPYNIQELPPHITDILHEYDSVVSTNCFSYSLYKNKDLYGFDLVVEAFYSLSKREKIHNTLLVLVDPSATTSEYVKSLLENKTFGTNDVLFVEEKIDFVALVKLSNLTVRATRTDGDSISVRESLYYNIPVIASDVTTRPEGTIIFKNENIEDLETKIFETLRDKNRFAYKNIDYGKKIIDLYHDF